MLRPLLRPLLRPHLSPLLGNPVGRFNPRQLFSSGEPGAHFEAYNPDTLVKRRNLFTYSEGDSTKFSSASNVSDAAVSIAGFDASIAFVDNTLQRSFQKASPNVTGQRYTASVYVQMDDNSVPVVSRTTGAGDLTIAATASIDFPSTVEATSTPGVYRVSWSFVGNAAASASVGVNKYTGQSAKGFRVTGFQLDVGSVATPYQRVTDWQTEYLAAVGDRIGMWQDASGQTPAMKIEDLVGLWEDVSRPIVPVVDVAGGIAGWSGNGTNPPAVNAADNYAGSPCASVTFPVIASGSGGYAVCRADGASAPSVRHDGGAVGTLWRFTYEIALSRPLVGGESITVYTTGASGGTVSVLNRNYTPTQWDATTTRTLIAVTGSNFPAIYVNQADSPVTLYLRRYTATKRVGNHATQGTTASRPTLSARYSLLTKTEQFDDAVWTKSMAGTGAAPLVTSNFDVAPDGTTTAARVLLDMGAGATASDYSLIQQSVGPAGARRLRVAMKTRDGSTKQVALRDGSFQVVTVTPVWQWFTYDEAAPSIGFQIILRGTYGTSASADLLVWHPDLRTADDAAKNIPAYQRVNTATDMDSDGFGHFDKLDGVDDHLTGATGGGGTAGFLFCSAITVSGGAGAARTLWSDAGTNTGYRVRINASNQLELAAGNGTAFTTVATAAPLPVAETHVVTAWDDGTNLNVQIDNGAIASVARPVVSAGAAGFTVGRDNGASSAYFNGRIYANTYRQSDCGDIKRALLKRWHANKAGVVL